jgi:hypothetical protein
MNTPTFTFKTSKFRSILLNLVVVAIVLNVLNLVMVTVF